MHPALSVIAFTTLSGAGFGLLCWLGISLLLLHTRGDVMPMLHSLQLWSLGIGAALAVIGLLSSLAHLGQPGRAWRALSQWRTSWLSREGVLAIATLLIAAALLVLLNLPIQGATRAIALGAGGLLLALLSLATVASTAMIYACLRPIPAWTHPLVVPVYLLFSLLTGLGLLLVLMSALLPRNPGGIGMLVTLAVLAVALAALKLAYWHGIAKPLPGSRGAAVGMPDRKLTVFERPHTQDSFVTREMAFVVARRHALVLRVVALALLTGLPLLACGLAVLWPAQTMAWPALATLGILAGAFVERWLFFAEARHVVTHYY